MSFSLDLSGNTDKLKVSATDVASSGSCARHLAVKIRPDVKSKAWQRSFGSQDTFVLGLVLQLVLEAHPCEEAKDPARLSGWLQDQFERRGVHRLLRPYAATAIANILEVHDDIEAEIGPLRLLANNPSIGGHPRTLTVWAPLYVTADGIREVRRYRLGSAHTQPSDADALWIQTAARIAAGAPPKYAATRIRVVEVGAGDATLSVVFDDTPDAANRLFENNAKAVAGSLGDLTTPTPGSECSSCKVAGVCDALIPMPTMLGQTTHGYASRSVAPSDLDRYRRCPAQWLLASDLHLPRISEDSEAQTRGLLVHQWLQAAHERGVGCTEDDLPEPGSSRGLAEAIMTAEDYRTAFPFLSHHIATCPLGADAVDLVDVESAVFGFDAAADVVTVTKPDLVFRLGDRLVIREFKTSVTLPAGGEDEVYRQQLQVPFLLSMLTTGLAQAAGATTATVEVEVLTPHGGEVYAWDTDDPALVAAARTDVANAARDWHVDSTWDTKPGPQCTWCPVRRWCPDRDAYELSSTTRPGPAANQTTVASYELIARDYARGTEPNPEFGRPGNVGMNRLIETAGPGGVVLEIGSGPGWDADHVEEHGPTVKRTDAAAAFVEFQAERGKSVEVLNAVTDDLGGPYDAIMAMAVLQHLDPDDVPDLLARVAGALRSEGALLVCLREGSGNVWEVGESGNSYFVALWTQDDFEDRLRDVGLRVEWVGHDVSEDDEAWMTVFARK